MIKTKHLIFVFLPAIFLVSLVFFIRVTQYEPLYEKQNPKKESPTEIFIPIFKEDPLLGKKNAINTVVVFEDLACEACQQQIKTLRQIIKENPNKLKVIVKNLSVTQFPHPSETAHIYAYCANQQDKYDEFEEAVYTTEGRLDTPTMETIATIINLDSTALQTCLNSGKAEEYQAKVETLARDLGIQAVPEAFLKNTRVTPNLTKEGWAGLLGL